jgi:hypothetical protein
MHSWLKFKLRPGVQVSAGILIGRHRATGGCHSGDLDQYDLMLTRPGTPGESAGEIGPARATVKAGRRDRLRIASGGLFVQIVPAG